MNNSTTKREKTEYAGTAGKARVLKAVRIHKVMYNAFAVELNPKFQ